MKDGKTMDFEETLRRLVVKFRIFRYRLARNGVFVVRVRKWCQFHDAIAEELHPADQARSACEQGQGESDHGNEAARIQRQESSDSFEELEYVMG